MTRWYVYDTVLSKPYSFWKFVMFSKFRIKNPKKPLEKGEPVFFRKLLLKVVALSGAEMWLIRSQKSWF